MATPLEHLGAAHNDLWGDDWPEVRELWPLSSALVHLNHGAYGAVPRAVLEEQRSWRERMEENPGGFMSREVAPAVEDARRDVARFLDADEDGVALVPNARTGVVTALDAARLQPGDRVVLTDHAFAPVAAAVHSWCERYGATVVVAHVPLRADEAETAARVLEVSAESGAGPAARLVLLDQVTSATARTLPLATLLPQLRELGATTLVDAAHAPGMLPLDLSRLGADFWVGTLHKWACAPRGTAALWVAPDWRDRVQPLNGSWGDARGFPRTFNVTGTGDPTAWLAAPRALRLLNGLGWARVRDHNVQLATRGQRTIASALEIDPTSLPHDPQVSMQLVPLPSGLVSSATDALALQARIAENTGIEVGVSTWGGDGFLRVSAHAYNCPADYERLAEVLPSLL